MNVKFLIYQKKKKKKKEKKRLFTPVVLVFLYLHLIFSRAVSLSLTITFRKPYIGSLEIWTIGLWTNGLLDSCKLWHVGPFNYYNVKYQIDSYSADSCAISPSAFLLLNMSIQTDRDANGEIFGGGGGGCGFVIQLARNLGAY